MKKTTKFIYNIVFWISRIFTLFIFGICLSMVLHAKYVISEKCFYFIFKYFHLFINCFFDNGVEFIGAWISNIFNINVPFIAFDIYKSINFFCKNAQEIDLLLTALILTLIMCTITFQFIKKKLKYLLLINIISCIVYLIMYSIFKLPIMLALTISTPIVFIIIYFLNKICPIQKIIMLIPIIGEIFCTETITKYVFKKNFNRFIDISLLIITLITTNIICFLFSYKTDRDFENRILDNWTYIIRTYQDKMIVSGENELILIDKEGINTYVKNDEFGFIEDFIIDNSKEKLYIPKTNFASQSYSKILVLDLQTLKITNDFNIDKITDDGNTKICCNTDLSKIIVIYEAHNIGYLIDLNTNSIKYIKGVSGSNESLIYNKYRKCFLLSFYNSNDFLQEIDIDNKKIRNIKADKYQGYLAMSKRNREVYVAFHQQGRIGVYDAETMKLKRKIKSNYMVADITYDEDLNILIAPSYCTGYVDIFLMDGSDKLLTREFVGYELREGCFDPQKENLYVCSMNGLYKKQIDIKKLLKLNIK